MCNHRRDIKMKFKFVRVTNMSKEIYINAWNDEISKLKDGSMCDINIAKIYSHFPHAMLQKRQNFDNLNKTLSMEANRLSRNNKCICGSGKKEKHCHNGILYDSFTGELLSKMNYTDNYIDNLKQQFNINTICCAGCNDCCADYFYISKFEYYIIRNYILSTMGQVALKKYIAKAIINVEILKKEYPDEYENIFIKNADELDYECNFKSSYLKKFRMCIFNNENTGKCEIYDSRPPICRLYGINSFSICDKIRKKCSRFGKLSISKARKHLIDLTNIMEYMQDDNDKIYIPEINQYIIQRNMPIIFWFSNDKCFESDYKNCISMTKERYLKSK